MPLVNPLPGVEGGTWQGRDPLSGSLSTVTGLNFVDALSSFMSGQGNPSRQAQIYDPGTWVKNFSPYPLLVKLIYALGSKSWDPRLLRALQEC
jgi:hypothetical protein